MYFLSPFDGTSSGFILCLTFFILLLVCFVSSLVFRGKLFELEEDFSLYRFRFEGKVFNAGLLGLALAEEILELPEEVSASNISSVD